MSDHPSPERSSAAAAMIKRLLTTITTTIAVILAVVLASASVAGAETFPVSSLGNTRNGTSESGTGAMTSFASVEGQGGPELDPEHPSYFTLDEFGRIGAQAPVEGGTTYDVTITLEGAVANETATGQGTARGFVEVELYDCCFAGESSPIGNPIEAELPATAGQVEVTTQVTLPRDTNLLVNVKLHSYASVVFTSLDTASVDASTDTTSVDVTPAADQPPPPPAAEPAPRRCILFLCF